MQALFVLVTFLLFSSLEPVFVVAIDNEKKANRNRTLKPTRKPSRKPTKRKSKCSSTASDADKRVACEYIYYPDLKECFDQTVASVYSNPFPVPTQIGLLTNLESLRISESSGKITSYIGCLTKLTYLDLSGNELTGRIPTFLGSLTNLIALELNFNQLTGTIPTFLGSFTKLRSLSLISNQLTGSMPTSICDLGAKAVIDCKEIVCDCCLFCR